MFTRAAALMIDENQRQQLESWARAGTTPQRVARKCRVVLLASQGVSNHAIAQQTGLSRPTILAARAAFSRGGCEALRQPQKRRRSRRVLTPGAAAEDLGYHAENAAARGHPLECARARPAPATLPHDGTPRLATL